MTDQAPKNNKMTDRGAEKNVEKTPEAAEHRRAIAREKKEQLCDKCGKPRVSGSITQWIFGTKHCFCPESAVNTKLGLSTALCAICGKPLSTGARGTVTHWIFRSEICDCAKRSRDQIIRRNSADGSICPHCRKVRRRLRVGSMTSWVFGSTTCTCEDSVTSQTDAAAASSAVSQAANEVRRSPAARSFGKPDHRFDYSSSDPLIGQLLFGDFKIMDKLGEGAMAVVYRARHISFDQLVAVKTVKTVDSEMMARFRREVRTHAKLRHENIVEPITCLDGPDGKPYFIMEYLQGISLEELLSAHGRMEREEEVAHIAVQICSAIHHAHQMKVIHRDLKPANIVILFKDRKIIAKVVDFGLAKLEEEFQRITLQKITQPGDVLGSPLYMSPEQCRGEALTTRSDVYALGLIIYEMVTGRPAYQSENVLDIIKAHCNEQTRPEPMVTLSPEFRNIKMLERIVWKAIETDANMRYQTVADFKKDIIEWWHSLLPEPGIEREIEGIETGIFFSESDLQEQQKSICAVVAVAQLQILQEKAKLLNSGTENSVWNPSTAVSAKPSSSRAMVKMLVVLLSGAMFSALLACFIIVNLDGIQSAWVNSCILLTKAMRFGPPKTNVSVAAASGTAHVAPKPAASKVVTQSPFDEMQKIYYGHKAEFTHIAGLLSTQGTGNELASNDFFRQPRVRMTRINQSGLLSGVVNYNAANYCANFARKTQLEEICYCGTVVVFKWPVKRSVSEGRTVESLATIVFDSNNFRDANFNNMNEGGLTMKTMRIEPSNWMMTLAIKR